MNSSNKLLSDITAFRTYAKYLQNLGRRETLAETINRDMTMHLDRFPKLSRDIIKAFGNVHDLSIMPSMRSLQFAGDAILKNNARQFNCSFTNIDGVRKFPEILFLLLSGVGAGYSVQKRHTSQLPRVGNPREEGLFVVHDSIVGWAQALEMLVNAYFNNSIKPVFDLSGVRPKGSYLITTGAKAPGPEPLKYMLGEVEARLKKSIGRQLRPIEVHDIVCIISDCVLAGGIRRAATISLFDRDDEEMLRCKSGEWYINHPYRARANNSAVLPRNLVTKEEFDYIFSVCKDSGAGEPGFSWTDNLDWGFNPCVTGDTEILTKDGHKRIDGLVDTNVDIWNGFEWSSVTPKVTGTNQPTKKITFSDGRTLTCTDYHKFHIATDYLGRTDVVKAKDLQVGMRLIKHKFPILEGSKELSEAYVQGFHSAEGMDGYNYFYVPEYKFLPKSFVPFDYTVKTKVDWLSGLFDGDGSELKEGGLQLAAVDKEFILNLQKLLSTIGIQSKVSLSQKARMRNMPDGRGSEKLYQCQDLYRICIGAVQMQELKALGLKCERMSFDKTHQRDASQFVKVVSVEDAGIAETVYCFNEPKRHLGVFNGVITGQCHEIALQSNQFCNLTTINQTGIRHEKDFLKRVYSAALIGTLQASYTDFPYLSDSWRTTTEHEALLGVSFTGVADAPGIVTQDLLVKGANLVLEVNEKYARKIGINLAARTTAIKPEGTSSCVLGSSSGIHARHAQYYLRRIRMNKDDSLARYLSNVMPELVEDDKFSSTGVVVTIPQESPSGSILRENESALDLFNRAMFYNNHWVANGHRSGVNKHNVSTTISVKDNEWEGIREAMWEQKDNYSGISLLPYDGGSYQQAPFEAITKEEYESVSKLVKEVDLSKVKEESDNTSRVETVACAGGVCEL